MTDIGKTPILVSMNVLEVRNHARRELVVAATRLEPGQFLTSVKRSRRLRWRSADRLVCVLLGQGLDRTSARAFLKSYCVLRAMPGWRVRRHGAA